MLIEFNIENFRSIKEELTLSMVSTKDKSFENNLIKTKVLKNDSLVKSAVLYGANASGKTNVLIALNELRDFVLTSHKNQKGDEIPFYPFKLDKLFLKKPTKLSVTFIKDGTKYIYGISYNKEKIISEYLYYFPKNYKKIIFKRKNTNKYSFINDAKQKEKEKFISDRLLDNVLFLSKATQEKLEIVSPAFDWFKDNLRVILSTDNPDIPNVTVKMLENDNNKKVILKAIYEADVGIDNILVTMTKFEQIKIFKGASPKVKELILAMIEDIGIESPKKFKIPEIKMLHNNVPFDLLEESDGTRRMLSLIGPWIDALKNGRILVVDEIDTKLHPKLNEFLIKLFHDETQNKKNAQLIITTHNTNLLDIQDIFRRDQIWFTEKNNKTGATDLYSLVEFSPRKDKNIEKGYLAGKYGAIPYIGDYRIFEDGKGISPKKRKDS